MSLTFQDYFSTSNSEKWISLKNKKILIVNTQWNEDVISGLTKGAKKLLSFVNVAYDVLTVPGAYEIPLAINKKINDYDGFITLGCLIKGDTYHFEAISYAATVEISKLINKYNKPISFGVLMVKNKKDAIVRSNDDNGNKGVECAAATLDMLLI